MYDWLYHRVRASPDDRALIRAETGTEWTFAELDEAVRRASGRLDALGVEPGDHLGVTMKNRVAAVVVIHAALRIGATLVPVAEQSTPRELRTQLERADVTTLVCDESTEQAAVEAAGEIPLVTVDDPHWEAIRSLSDVDSADVSPAEWALDDTQLLLFTSGTTGEPKAVRLTAGNLLFSAMASTFRLGSVPGDRWLAALSIHHMGGIGPLLRGPLYGSTVVIRESFDAGVVVDDIDRYDVTGVSLVPTMLKRMLDSRGTLSDSLRVVLLGGAPAPDALVERCRNYSIPIYPTYGMTETASQVATAHPGEAFEHVGTVGRPLFWTDLRVVDEEGAKLGAGEVGELVVAGPTVSPGYYEDEAATRAVFGPDGLRTGDMGYRDEEGRFYVLNRKDDRIVTGGENVDPGEVIGVLRESDAVEDASVVGVPDEEWGERVAAMVVPATDQTIDTVALEAHCRERLAAFKIPKTWLVVGELPRTVTGTVERRTVRARLREEVEVDVPDAEAGYPDAEADPEDAADESTPPVEVTDPEGDGERGESEATGGQEGTEDERSSGRLPPRREARRRRRAAPASAGNANAGLVCPRFRSLMLTAFDPAVWSYWTRVSSPNARAR